MYKPHYWYHGNLYMIPEKIDDIFNYIDKTPVKKLLDGSKNHLTTYFDDDDLSDFFTDFYDQVGAQIMKKIGLYSRTKFETTYWSQIYSKCMNHSSHNHCSFECEESIISWVHFINVPEQKCFKFTDNDGNVFYPPEQRNGDIIYFPSWAYHAVDPNETNDIRVVIAGNITVTDSYDIDE